MTLNAQSFWNRFITLSSGNLVAQAIPLVSMPFITRLYTPEEFGMFGVFVSALILLSIISTGRLELAIIIPEEEEEAADLLRISIILCTLFSFLTFLFLYCFGNFINTKIQLNIPNYWLFLLPISVLFVGIFSLLNHFNIRNSFVNVISKVNIAKSIILSVLQVGAGSLSLGGFGLTFSNTVAQMAACVLLGKNGSQYRRAAFPNQKRFLSLLKKYYRFPVYSLPSAILNAVSTQLPIIIFSIGFSPSFLGFYVVANKVMSLPVTIIANSVGQLFFRDAAMLASDDHKLADFTNRIFLRLFYIGALPCSVAIFYGADIFKFILGDEWVISGQYAQIMSAWLFLVFIGLPINHLVSIRERQKSLLIFNIIIFACRFLVLLYGVIILQDEYSTILLFTISSCICWIGWISYLLSLAYLNQKRIIFRCAIILSCLLLFIGSLKALL